MTTKDRTVWMGIAKAIGTAAIAAAFVVTAFPAWGATWMTQIGDVKPDWRGGGVVANADGSYFLVGRVPEPYRFPDPPGLTAIVKINADGTVAWARQFSNGVPLGFDKTADGGLIVLMVPYMSNPLLVRLDAAGAPLWQYQLDQSFKYVVMDGSSFYLTGEGYGQDGAPGIGVARLNLQTLQVEWAKFLPIPYDFWLDSTRRDADGGLLLAAHKVILKVSPSGVVSARMLGGSAGNVYDIVPLADGYALAGDAAGDQAFVAKLTSAWALRWQKTLSGSCSSSHATRIALLKNGSLQAAGQTTCWNPAGQNDAWAFNVSAGNTWKMNWQKRYWTVGRQEIESLVPTSDGGMILAGPHNSYPDQGDGPGTLLAKTDAAGAVSATNACGTTSACPAVTTIAAMVNPGTVSITSITVTTEPLAFTLTPAFLDPAVDVSFPMNRFCR